MINHSKATTAFTDLPESLIAIALSAVSEGLIIADAQQNVIYTNDAFTSITGYSKAEICGNNCRMLQGPDSDLLMISRMRAALENGLAFSGELLNYRKDGSTFWNQISITPCKNSAGQITHYISVVHDITTERELGDRLEAQALHDPLTGLPNRFAIEQHLPKGKAYALMAGKVIAVCILDLDGFTQVNENHGRAAGDQLLQGLAKRLRGELRQDDMLARLGGDEFALIIRDLDETGITEQLQAVLERVHHAVETPFTFKTGETMTDMSMGIALYPLDGVEGDALLRHADEALRLAKVHKHDRTKWWRLASDELELPEDGVFDPYGRQARALLSAARNELTELAIECAEKVTDEVRRMPQISALVDNLDGQDIASINQLHVEQLLYTLSPSCTFELVEEAARIYGQHICLLAGSTSIMVKSIGIYRNLLRSRQDALSLQKRHSSLLLMAIERRLQDSLQAQLLGAEDTIAQYMHSLSAALPKTGALWADVAAHEIEQISKLPGILCVLLVRLAGGGMPTVEQSAGSASEQLLAQLQILKAQNIMTTPPQPGHGLFPVAWRTQQIVSSPSHRRDPRYMHLHSIITGDAMCSTMVIPVFDQNGHAAVYIAIGGAHPNQFESSWMRQFAQGLQTRWSEIWQRCSAPASAVVVEHNLAMGYREQLFNGGLVMHMQPVVELRGGAVLKVEALARLVMQDGTIVPPAMFLPLLGDAELDELFRLGVDQALTWLAHWDTLGISLQIAVNLPPSTLLDQDCPDWVEAALHRHGIAPERLNLELLETQAMGSQAQNEAVGRLARIGVKLVLDDLGSGYSSLLRLSGLPFSAVKIDQGLIAKIRVKPVQTLSLMSTLIQIGRDFERNVVVEGLEDIGVIEAASILGASLGQGYGLARPMPADEIAGWINQFSLPTKPGTIQTWLGALAYHWQFARLGAVHPHALEDCPLQVFFKSQNLPDSNPAAWHAQLHKHIKNHNAPAKMLMDWLVEQVQS